MIFRCLLVLSVIVLVGCQLSGYKHLKLVQADENYQNTNLNWTSGQVQKIYIKAIKHGSYLGLCGYFVTSGSIQAAIEEEFMRQTEIWIGDEKVTSSAAFLTEELRDYDKKYSATCVLTEKKYRDTYSNQRIRFKGPKSVLIVH